MLIRIAGSPRTALLLLVIAPLALWTGVARGERAWIEEELRIKVRSRPETDALVIGVVKTGDSVEVVRRQDRWIEIRVDTPLVGGVKEGWIPSGYLQSETPAVVQLARRDAERAALKQSVEELTSEVERLRSENLEMSGRDAGREESLDRLERENTQLRAQRWPEWIAGACILAAGMIAGSLIARNRRKPRIRF